MKSGPSISPIAALVAVLVVAAVIAIVYTRGSSPLSPDKPKVLTAKDLGSFSNVPMSQARPAQQSSANPYAAGVAPSGPGAPGQGPSGGVRVVTPP